jgi:hypothetical protein
VRPAPPSGASVVLGIGSSWPSDIHDDRAFTEHPPDELEATMAADDLAASYAEDDPATLLQLMAQRQSILLERLFLLRRIGTVLRQLEVLRRAPTSIRPSEGPPRRRPRAHRRARARSPGGSDDDPDLAAPQIGNEGAV